MIPKQVYVVTYEHSNFVTLTVHLEDAMTFAEQHFEGGKNTIVWHGTLNRLTGCGYTIERKFINE
jgi:hypothetical protein